MAGAAILATATLIMDADAAYADSKTIQLPYTTATDLKSKCDAANGKFEVIGSAYSCDANGGTVNCDSDTKKCSGYTKSASLRGHSSLPARAEDLPQFSPAQD